MSRSALVLLVAVVAAEVAAAVGAWRARAIRGRVVVALCAFAAASDLALDVGRALLLAGAPRPFVGLARAWYTVETAIVLAWPCALWVAAWRLLAGPLDPWREPSEAHAVGAWIGVGVGLACTYPYTSGEVAAALLAVEFAAVVASWVAVARGWRSRLRSRSPWALSEVAVLVLVGVETAVTTIGPWVRNPFADWHLARASYLLGFSAVALLHVQTVRRRVGL